MNETNPGVEVFRYAAPLADGSTLHVVGTRYAKTPDPVPVPDPAPAPRAVRIGGATFPVAAVNPAESTSRPYPGGRGVDELVLYQAPTLVTATNQYGTEVEVIGGKVGAVWDRQALGRAPGISVPRGGYILSGHGKARAYLNQNATAQAAVELLTEAPAPEPLPAPPTRRVAIFRKDGSGTTAQLPAGLTTFIWSFFQQNRLVEWGGETLATQTANLGRWLDANPSRRLQIAVGGAKGTVSTSNRGAFLEAFLKGERDLGDRCSGIVWDVESSALNADDVLAISRSLASGRESWYEIGFTPPGGTPVATYLKAALMCHQAGLKVWFGQQLYESPRYITEADALTSLERAISAGLPPSAVVLGTMVGSDQRHWTIPMCVQVLKAALKRWPDLGGVYLWSEGQEAQDAEWIRQVAAVLS